MKELVPEKTVKEIREQKRAVNQSKRKLDNQKKMLKEIKKQQKGKTVGAKMMTKDIVRTTNQSKKIEKFIDQLTAVSMSISYCESLNELKEAMNNVVKAMTIVSNKLDFKNYLYLEKNQSKKT